MSISTSSLSSGYFKKFDVKSPVLQVLQARSYDSDIIRLRLMCSDGSNAYDQIGVSKKLDNFILKSGLYKRGKHPIIKIRKMQKIGCTIIIEKFEIMHKNVHIIGSPKSIYCKCHGHGTNEILTGFKPTPLHLEKLEEKKTPINYINQWAEGPWTIKATITDLDGPRDITSKYGVCKFFTFVASDEDGHRIRFKAFADNALHYSGIVENGGLYFFQFYKKSIRLPQTLSDIGFHDFEIVLNRDSMIKRVTI